MNTEERLEQIAQRVENVIADRDSRGLLTHTVGQSTSSYSDFLNGDKAQTVSEVVKDIITHDFGDTDEDEDSIKNTMSPSPHKMHLPKDDLKLLRSQNQTLRDNLGTVEDELLRMTYDRDTLAIKFNAINDRLQKADRRASGISDDNSPSHSLSQINLQLRKQLEDDHKEYRQKLAGQQEHQLKQAELIKKLQNKLEKFEGRNGLIEQAKAENDKLRSELGKIKEFYHTSTNDLNRRLEQAENKLKAHQEDKQMDFDSLLQQLKEEKAKTLNLAQVNGLLREQLDEATNANQGLIEDVQKLTDDWHLLRSELDQKEQEWKEDETAFNRYVSGEQSRIKTLWNNFISFKRQFNEIKNSNERDIYQLRADVEHSTQSIRLACANLDTNTQNRISQLEFQLETEKTNVNRLEASLQRLKEESAKTEKQYQKELENLNEQFAHVNKTNEQLTKELTDKEKVLSTLQKLRSGIYGDIDNGIFPTDDAAARQLIIDTDAIHQALRDIAQMVMLEGDAYEESPWVFDDSAEDLRGIDQMKQTISVNSLQSNRSISPIKSPKKFSVGNIDKQRMYRSKSPLSIADSTCAAVRAALQKRALQVQDLTAKLNSMKNSLKSLKTQLDESENERRSLEKQFIELRREYDSNHRELDDIQRECERMKMTIALLEDDKGKIDKNRTNIQDELKNLKQDLDKVKTMNYELQRDKETLEDKYVELERNLDRQTREVDRLQKSGESSDSKNSKLREELASLKESLSKTLLDKEVLEQEKGIVIDSLNQAELLKAECEVKLNKMRTDEAKYRDKLHQLETINHSTSKENSELKVLIDQFESEKRRLANEKKALEQEKFGIREELQRVENEKEELNQMKDGLHQSMQNVEKSYENLQTDLSKLNYEKIELENINLSLQKERNSISNELLQARRDAERLSSAVQKLMKEKEIISKEKSDLITQLNTFEREVRDTADAIYAIQEDKEHLESALFDSQKTIEQLEAQIETLENNFQQVEKKRSSLFDEKQKLQHEFDVELQKLNKAKDNLQIKMNESEREWSKMMKVEKKGREDDIERLVNEREELQAEFSKYKENMKSKYYEEIDDVRQRLTKEKEELAQEIITIQRERDDCLLENEMSKQHAINILEQEKMCLYEKISSLSDSLKVTETDLNRTRSECESRAMQDLNTIQSLNTDLKKFRLQFEQIHADHDREIKNLQNSYKELESQRYQDMREIDELKSLLKISEETRDNLRQELSEIMTKLRDLEEQREKLRRELQEEKRNFYEEKQEAETLKISNKELRQKLKQSEMQKIDLQRQVGDCQTKLLAAEDHKSHLTKELKDARYTYQEVEKARSDARRELEELRNQIKKLDTERGKLVNEVGNLQVRITSDEEKEVEARRENFGLKQRMIETEATKEEITKQLIQAQRRIDDLEELISIKDKSNKQSFDEFTREIKELQETKANVEGQLETLTHILEELKTNISARDAKIAAYENHITNLEQRRKNAESRLAAIHGHLRKMIGFRQQFCTMPIRNRSPSPGRSRSISPDKGRVSSRNSIENYPEDQGSVPGSDLEPESVRLALRDINQHITNLERQIDEVEMKAKNSTLKNDETTAQLEQALQRINHLQKCFGEVEEDKRGVDTRLSSAQTALMMQEETIYRNERERKALIDKVTKLERQLAHADNEKKYLQDRVEKLRNSENYHEEERKGMIKALDDAENRCTQLELLRRGLEGELQRLKMVFNDKETENQVLKDRIDNLTKQISDLESKAQCLQLTIDRLSMNLAKTEQEENTQKDKVHQLNLTISENQGSLQSLQDKILHLQGSLASSEHERRVLQERIDSLKHSLSEVKAQNHNITDRLQMTQQELTDSENRRKELEIESKRLSQMLAQRQEIEQDLQTKLHRAALEKNLITERLNSLTASLAGLESERRDIERSHSRAEKERTSLKKTLDKLEKEKSKSEEIANLNLIKRSEFDEIIHRLEEENEVLHRQVQKLQCHLAEAEQTHAQRLMELSSRIKSEMLSEIDRLKSALSSTEKTLQFREKSHRQKVKSLEEQLNILKDQLAHELKKRETYLNKSARSKDASNDISKRSIENLLYELELKRGLESIPDPGYSTSGSPSSTMKHSNRPTSRLDSTLPRQNYSTSPTRAGKNMSSKKLMKKSTEFQKMNS